MDANSLEVGAAYFRITYADVAQTIPSVESLIYAGVNILGSPSGGSAKYYFQDVVSVVQFGLRPGMGQKGQSTGNASDIMLDNQEERVYSTHEAREIGEVIVDLKTLAAEIDWTYERAKELGFPKLLKAEGNWV